MNKKYKGQLIVLTMALTLLLAACGNSGEVHETNVEGDDQIEIEEFPPKIIDSMEGNSSQEDSADPPPVIEESSYEGSGQLPEEITKQIEIYVNQREVWLLEPHQYDPYYYYAWNDLNLDGSLELICSYYEGTGWYSRSYVYAINSDGEVECVAKLDREDAPDLLWGLELYADTQEGQDPRHFYIRTGDVTKDARYLYRTDTAVTFTAELTDWQQERIRSCTEEYRDVTHSELVDATYRGSGWETISREEWEQLEEEFLKGKEFITADFAWDRLWTYTYEELAENALTDQELGENLEALYIRWENEASQKVLTESEAAETLIYYLQSSDDYYPDIAICDDAAVIIREWPSEDGTKILHITGEDLANDEQYYIFEYWCDLYDTGFKDGVATHEFTRSYYWGSFAVNKYNGEVVEERIHDPETYLWEWNEEFFDIINPSREHNY